MNSVKVEFTQKVKGHMQSELFAICKSAEYDTKTKTLTIYLHNNITWQGMDRKVIFVYSVVGITNVYATNMGDYIPFKLD